MQYFKYYNIDENGRMQMRKNKITKRQYIIEENLLQYKDRIKQSERNLKIVEEIAEGIPCKAVAEKYGLSMGRVQQILGQYISHCRFYIRGTNIYTPKEELFEFLLKEFSENEPILLEEIKFRNMDKFDIWRCLRLLVRSQRLKECTNGSYYIKKK